MHVGNRRAKDAVQSLAASRTLLSPARNPFQEQEGALGRRYAQNVALSAISSISRVCNDPDSPPGSAIK